MTSWSSALGGRSSPGECRDSQAGVPVCESVVTVSPGAGVSGVSQPRPACFPSFGLKENK